MAENLDSKNSEEVRNEHDYRFKFKVHPYPVIRDVEYLHVHHTHCKSLPTSWETGVRFQERSPKSCFLSLSRSDSIDKHVDVYVWVSCYDINNRSLCFPRLIFNGGIHPSLTEAKCIRELVPEEKLRFLEEQTLVFEVSAIITSCHQIVEPSAAHKN